MGNFNWKLSSENTVGTRSEVDTTGVLMKHEKSTKLFQAEDYKETSFRKHEKKENLKNSNKMARTVTGVSWSELWL